MTPSNFPRPLKVFLALFTLLFAGHAYAANWYVRPNAAGSSNGADWNNAWSMSGISWSNVKPGDTIWLAGGTYSGGLNPAASGTSGNPITINRVLATDAGPTAAAGWSSSFDSQVIIQSGVTIATNSWVTISGREIDSAGKYGISVPVSFPGGGNAIVLGNTSSNSGNIGLYYIDMPGPYGTVNHPVNNESIALYFVGPGSSGLSNVYMGYCQLKGYGEGSHFQLSNLTMDHCIVGDTQPCMSGEHPDTLFIYPSPNMTIRYCTFFNTSTDGIFLAYGGAVNFYFYGNVVYNTPNHNLYFDAAEAGDTYGPFYIYNNVFHGIGTQPYQFGYVTMAATTKTNGACFCYNNVFLNVLNSIDQVGGVTSDYNAYNYTTLNGYPWPSNETHSFTFTNQPFINIPANTQPDPANSNFRLVASAATQFAKGIAIPAVAGQTLNTDLDGNTRSAPWTIGAFQSGATSSPPAGTSGLRITAP
jgi:hypothetical protein